MQLSAGEVYIRVAPAVGVSTSAELSPRLDYQAATSTGMGLALEFD